MVATGLVLAATYPVMFATTVGEPEVYAITMAEAPVVVVRRATLVENEQPVPSVLSKSKRAILPLSAAALVTVHEDGEFENVATTMSAVTS